MRGAHILFLIAGCAEASPNTLSPSEEAAGYDLLFNGKDLSGWRGYRKAAPPDGWYVNSNAPLGPRIQIGNGERRNLVTEGTYRNVDLKVDAQTPPSGESGIFIRFEETAESPYSSQSGPELQICGTQSHDCFGAYNSFGACYDMFTVNPTLRDTWFRPSGEWNQIRIIAFDSNYVHYGNGRKLLEYKLGTPDFMQAYGNSKFASDGNDGRYYHIHPGMIMLEHHGEIGVSFRNIKAKELSEHPFRQEFPDGMWPDSLPHDFVFRDPPVHAVSRARNVRTRIEVARAGAGVTLVRIPVPHADFQVQGTDGRAFPWSRTGTDAYALDHQEPAILIVHFRTGGRLQAQVITLP